MTIGESIMVCENAIGCMADLLELDNTEWVGTIGPYELAMRHVGLLRDALVKLSEKCGEGSILEDAIL